MSGRSRARYLAPIALVATLAGAYVVVQANLNQHKPAAHSGPRSRGSSRRGQARAQNYVVQPGDSLSTISAKTGVPLLTLERLNPSANPNSLQSGQRLRLRQ